MFDLKLSALLGPPATFERSREEGRSEPVTPMPDRTTPFRNKLDSKEAVALVRRIRAMTLKSELPDSTPGIRADRDAG